LPGAPARNSELARNWEKIVFGFAEGLLTFGAPSGTSFRAPFAAAVDLPGGTQDLIFGAFFAES
jgi:hypothetical protein